MEIAGSYCDAEFFQKYLGIRPEWVDMTEILRRITLGIYDRVEYEDAIAWIRENCREGFDLNAGKPLADIVVRSKVVPPERDWEFMVKVMLVCRDVLQ